MISHIGELLDPSQDKLEISVCQGTGESGCREIHGNNNYLSDTMK